MMQRKEQQEAQDAFDKAQAGIDSATDIEEAKNAYNQAAGIVGDAQKAYETAKQLMTASSRIQYSVRRA